MEPPLGPPEPDAPVQGRLPGWKVARLVIADDGSTRFAGLAANSVKATFYDADGAAHCSVGKSHRVPAWECSCGFHVARSIEELSLMYPDWDQPTFALLQVEAWGDVVEHDHGIRAQRQRVLGASIASWCTFCGESADLLGAHYAAPDSSSRYGPTELIHLVPACPDCNRVKCLGRTFTLAEVAGNLSVEVSRRDRREGSIVADRHARRRGTDVVLLAAAGLSSILAVGEFAGGSLLVGSTYAGTASLGVLGLLVGRRGRTRRRSLLAWAAGVGLAVAALMSLGGSAVSEVSEKAPWYEDAAAIVGTLPEDPYLASVELAELAGPYDVVPVGGQEGVEGIVAASSYAPSPVCAVLARSGEVLYEGEGTLTDCVDRSRDLLAP